MILLQSDLFAQRENLERVESAIAKTILEFVERRRLPWVYDGAFRMSELTEYVHIWHPNIAPDSAGRILRHLRQQGKCNYRVENRRASLYRVIACPTVPYRPTIWTDAKVDHMRELAADKYSAARIAELLGPEFTRNGVISKCNRTGIKLRLGANRQVAARRRRSGNHKLTRAMWGGQDAPRKPRAQNNAPVASPGTITTMPIAPEPRHVTLWQLTGNTCRWPYGDRAPYTFCGHPPARAPYCGFHSGLAWRASSK